MWRQIVLCLILSASPALAAGDSEVPGELNNGSPAEAAAQIALSGLSLGPRPVLWPAIFDVYPIGLDWGDEGIAPCGLALRLAWAGDFVSPKSCARVFSRDLLLFPFSRGLSLFPGPRGERRGPRHFRR